MKKFSFLLTFIIMFFLFCLNINALNINVEPNGVKVGKTFNLNVSDALKDSEAYEIKYDSNYITKQQVNGISGGTKLTIPNGAGSITFVVNSSLKLQNDLTTTISITDMSNGQVFEVNVKIISDKEHSNNTTTTTAPTTTIKPTSGNNNIKALEIKDQDGNGLELSPTFNSNTLNYVVTVPATTEKLDVNPTLEDNLAKISVKGSGVKLNNGQNIIKLIVTAENGQIKEYVITVTKEVSNSDATLKNLTIKELEDFKLTEGEYKYDIKVPKNINSLTINLETSNENASYEISGNEDLKDGSKIRILVKAEDGTKKEYVLTVNMNDKTTTSKVKVDKSSDKNPFVIMVLSIIAFGLVGSIVFVIKKQ